MYFKRSVLLMTLIAFCSILFLTPLSHAQANEKTTISIAAGRPGDPWYVLSHALASFINKGSDWLRADVVATAGVTDNTRLLMKKSKKRATHLNVTMIPGQKAWGKGEYIPLKIGTMMLLSSTWVSLDPNLKQLGDLSGKSVSLPRKSAQSYVWIFVDLLKQAGVWDSIIPMHGGLSSGLTALRDGAAQAGVLMFSYVYPDHYQLGGKLEQLQTRGTLYFLQQGNIAANQQAIADACHSEAYAGLDLPAMSIVVPPKALGETQTQPMAAVSNPVFWAAGKEMPEKVVFEITRILYENAQKQSFASYHVTGKGITSEFITTSFWETEELCRKNYHPGAVAFYDSVGAKLNTFGHIDTKKDK